MRPVAYAQDTLYLHEDHLGSIDVVSDASGAEIERRSYSPFGERRDPDWRRNSAFVPATLPNLSRFGLAVTQGYAGHEDDDVAAGLVDMQGRMYDARLGRFLSADPFVDQPLQTQGLNRYSYVRNNPLTLVDPTGYVAESLDRSFDVCFGGSCSGGSGSVDGSSRPTPGFVPDIDPNIQAFNPTPQVLTGPAKWLAAAGSAGLTFGVGALMTQGAGLCLASAGTLCGVLAVGAVGYGLYSTYKLVAGGGWRDIAAAGQRFWNDQGTLEDALTVGSAVAGIAMTLSAIPGIARASTRALAGVVAQAEDGLAAGGAERGVFSVGPYRPSATPLENHHGVLDVWASHPGYVSRGANTPTIALTEAQHAATKALYRDWLFEQTGLRVGGSVNWSQVSAREMQSLTNRMLDAAEVPAAARADYFRAFHRYIYGVAP